MAFYDYKCPKCGEGFEVTKPMSEAKREEKCPKCGEVADRILGGFTVDGNAFTGDGYCGTSSKGWDKK